MSSQEIACTLDPDARRAREADTARRLWPAVVRAEPVADGVLLWFERSPERLRDLADWALFESRCCAFLDLALELPAGGEGLRLRLKAPPEAVELVQREVLDRVAAAQSGSGTSRP